MAGFEFSFEMFRDGVLLDAAALLEDVQVNFRCEEGVGDEGRARYGVPAIGKLFILKGFSRGPGAL